MAPRPTLPEGAHRRNRITTRFTDDEYERLEALASAAGLPVAEYMRRTVLERRPRPRTPRSETMDEAMRELQRIATNFQQLNDATADGTFGQWAEWVGSSFAEALLARDDVFSLVKEQLPAINNAGQIVNQLARRANSGETVWDDDAGEACEAVETALRPLLDALEDGSGGQGNGNDGGAASP